VVYYLSAHKKSLCARKFLYHFERKITIHSRKSIKILMAEGDLKDKAIISFFSPQKAKRAEDVRINYSGVCDNIFYIGVPDIDLKYLSDYGYTYETYIEDTKGLSEFIYNAKSNGLDIICQCDFGQSRSAACASAILEHFEGSGIDIFSNYDYYPNQVVYHKVFDALENHLYDLAVDYIKTTPSHISVDNIQRKLQVGFGKANAIINKMLEERIIERDKNNSSKFMICNEKI